jgi:hypothetical protein
LAITGMTGAVYVSDVNTAPVSFNEESCIGDATRKRYRIDKEDFRYWDPDAPVWVQVNGVPIAAGFTLEHAGGFVVFDETLILDVEDEVTVSGKALTLIQAGGFFNWSIDGDGEDAEATTFASQGWKEFVRTLKGWSGSAEAYWGDTQFFDSLGEIVVVKLFVDAGPAQDCFEGFAIINGDGIEAPVDGLVQETIDFTGTGPLYLRV